MRRMTIVFIIFILAIGGIFLFSRKEGREIVFQSPIRKDSEQKFEVRDLQRTQLRDVAGGTGKGTAVRVYEGDFFVHAISADMPDPEGTDFYEGWLVRESPFDVISTGTLTKNKNGQYALIFKSDIDLADHADVVVTLEPEGGGPAPARHILEGTF